MTIPSISSTDNNIFKQAGFNVSKINPNIPMPKISVGTLNDSLKLSSKKPKNKKNRLAFFGLAGIVGIGVGIVSVLKKKKMPTNVSSSIKEANKVVQKAQKKAFEIYQQMEKMAKEESVLFHKVQEPDYQGTAKLTNGILEEFDSNGAMIKQSTFNEKGIIQVIEEYNGKTQNELRFLNGKPNYYEKGTEQLTDGSIKRDMILFFQNTEPYNKPSIYIEGINQFNGSYKQDTLLWFIDGKPSNYIKGYEKLADNSIKQDIQLEFIDGKWQEIK